MAKRGRPAGGEYPDKREVHNFRIRPDTKRMLAAAARRSGRTISQETEHQIRRALTEMGGPTHAILNAIGSAIDSLLSKTKKPEQWLEDPTTFDQFMGAVLATLELFRPRADIARIEGNLERHAAAVRGTRVDRPNDWLWRRIESVGGGPRPAQTHDQSARRELVGLLAQAVAIDPATPLAQQSPQQRQLGRVQQDLGPLIARPFLHELGRCPFCNTPFRAPTETTRTES